LVPDSPDVPDCPVVPEEPANPEVPEEAFTYPKVPVVTLYVTTFIKSCTGNGAILKLPVISKLPEIIAEPVKGKPLPPLPDN
jgi:hypothetical protein